MTSETSGAADGAMVSIRGAADSIGGEGGSVRRAAAVSALNTAAGAGSGSTLAGAAADVGVRSAPDCDGGGAGVSAIAFVRGTKVHAARTTVAAMATAAAA